MRTEVHKLFRKCRSQFKILSSRSVAWGMSHAGDAQILLATVQNLVATTTWRPGSCVPPNTNTARFNIKNVTSHPRRLFMSYYDYYNKQQLIPHTAFSDWSF